MFDSREGNFLAYKAHIDVLQQAVASANVPSPSPPPRQRSRTRVRYSNVRTMHGEPVIDVDYISSDSDSAVDGGLDGGLNSDDNTALDRIINGNDNDDSSSEE